MRLILECHSCIECYDERSSYRILCNELEPTHVRPLIGLKVPQLTEQLAAPCLRDDAAVLAGTPGIENPYRGEKVVFMIRDARDVVASMLTLNSWLTRFGNPVLEAKITGDPDFAERYSAEIEHVRASAHPEVARAALIWRYKVDPFVAYIGKGYPVLPVRYELLVTQPRLELMNVCKLLSVRYETSLLRHPSMPHRDLRASGLATGRTDPKRPIDDKGVGKWTEALSADQIEEILKIAGPAQQRFYNDG